MKIKATEKMRKLLKTSGNSNPDIALAAFREIVKALQTPLRQGVLDGDIIGGLFEVEELPPGHGSTVEYPLDFIAPGTEKDYVAYTLPNHGAIPHQTVEGDYVMIPTYDIGAALDWNLKYAKNARWGVVERAYNVLRSQFVKKMNDDGFHTIITAGVDRNLVVADSDAAAGQFTKRLVSLTKTVMRRNGGGNSSSVNRGKLTDLCVSPEAVEDIRNWNVDQVDEITRREIYVAEDGTLNRVFQVNLRDLDELGEGQEYNKFYTNTLSASIPTGDVEIGVGLDLSKGDTFVMPVQEELEIYEDSNLHRQRMQGIYGWQTQGFGVLDNRRVVLVSM